MWASGQHGLLITKPSVQQACACIPRRKRPPRLYVL